MRTGIIAVDFDGTCVTVDFPRVGSDIGAEYVLKALVQNGSKIILFTMRGNANHDWLHNPLDTNILEDAKEWFAAHDIPLWGVNVNPLQEQDKWTDSPKPFADVIIDDYMACAPMVTVTSRHSVLLPINYTILDWTAIARWLNAQGYISDEQCIKVVAAIRLSWTKL